MDLFRRFQESQETGAEETKDSLVVLPPDIDALIKCSTIGYKEEVSEENNRKPELQVSAAQEHSSGFKKR